jgi:aspartyl-tRNA(Asn)/glutamyl-tRNA(Gln) amidotransferase subunit A
LSHGEDKPLEQGHDEAAFRLESRQNGSPWQEQARFPGPGEHAWDESEPSSYWDYRLWATTRSGQSELWGEATWHEGGTIRVGVPRAFFFDDLDPEHDAAVKEALAVLKRITARVEDVVLPAPADKQESVRVAVRAAEAYAYHYPIVNKTPELYQAETLIRVRSGASVTAREYIQGRRDLEHVRRSIASIFDGVDVLVTPTIPIPTITLAEMSKDVSTSMQLGAAYLRNTSPFNVYGMPTISVPCGFTRSGLPIGLQVSGPNGGEAMVFRVAAAYERATEWHKAPLKSPSTVP